MSSRKAKNDSSRDDAVDKLEAKVGLLSLNAAGAEPQYLGSSSIFAFSRLINPSLRQVVSSDLPTGTVADGPENRVSVLPSPCLLPDHESAVRLSNVYFQNVNVHYPVLHEPTFRTWESMLLQESAGQANLHPDYISLFFLNMVRSNRIMTTEWGQKVLTLVGIRCWGVASAPTGILSGSKQTTPMKERKLSLTDH